MSRSRALFREPSAKGSCIRYVWPHERKALSRQRSPATRGSMVASIFWTASGVKVSSSSSPSFSFSSSPSLSPSLPASLSPFVSSLLFFLRPISRAMLGGA